MGLGLVNALVVDCHIFMGRLTGCGGLGKGLGPVNNWKLAVFTRREDLTNWAEVFRQFVSRNLKVFAYANNHYAGHGPATVKLFWDLFEKR